MRAHGLKLIIFLGLALFMAQAPVSFAELSGTVVGQQAADFKVTNNSGTDVTVAISIGLSYTSGNTQTSQRRMSAGGIENIIGESRPFTVPRGQTRSVTVNPVSAACVFPPEAVFSCVRAGIVMQQIPYLVAQLRPGTNVINIGGNKDARTPEILGSADRGFETEVTFSVRNATTRPITPRIEILDAKGNVIGSPARLSAKIGTVGRDTIAAGKTENIKIAANPPEMAFPPDATFRCIVAANDGTILNLITGRLSFDSRSLIVNPSEHGRDVDSGRSGRHAPTDSRSAFLHSFVLKNNLSNPVSAGIVLGLPGLTSVDTSARAAGAGMVTGTKLGQSRTVTIAAKGTETLEFTTSVDKDSFPEDAIFICTYGSGRSGAAVMGRLFRDPHVINIGSTSGPESKPGPNKDSDNPLGQSLESEIAFSVRNRTNAAVVVMLSVLSADGKQIGAPITGGLKNSGSLTVPANGTKTITIKRDGNMGFPSDARFRCWFKTVHGLYLQSVEGILSRDSRLIECTAGADSRKPDAGKELSVIDSAARITFHNNESRPIQVGVYIGAVGETSFSENARAGTRGVQVVNALAQSSPPMKTIAARAAETIEVRAVTGQPFPRNTFFIVTTSTGSCITVPMTTTTPVVNIGSEDDRSGRDSGSGSDLGAVGYETSVRFVVNNRSAQAVNPRIEIRRPDGSLIVDSRNSGASARSGAGIAGMVPPGGAAPITLDCAGEPFPPEAHFRCLISDPRGVLVGLVEGTLARGSRTIEFTGKASTSVVSRPDRGSGPDSAESALPTSVKLTLTSHLPRSIDLEGRLYAPRGGAVLGLPIRVTVPALGRAMAEFTNGAGIPPTARYEFKGRLNGANFLAAGQLDRDGLLVNLNASLR